jgi:hypothetical protein
MSIRVECVVARQPTELSCSIWIWRYEHSFTRRGRDLWLGFDFGSHSQTRVETLMTYLGMGDTYTPAHKDSCASTGQVSFG